MDSLPDWLLAVILIFCLAISAFFSASETAMMSLNRYKLKHLSDEGDKGAKRAEGLLQHTERLLGTILLGNNFVNILATSLGTILGIRWFGDVGVLFATIALTVLVLVFSEVAPKTFAALFPERIAFPASQILSACVYLLYPLVWLLNKLVAGILRPFGIKKTTEKEALTNEELKTIVLSTSPQSVSRERQDMLLGVLELEDVSVDEVMVPRNELEGVDLNDPWEDVLAQITQSRHGRLVAYRDNIDQAEGMLHLRDIIALYREGELNAQTISSILRPCVFVPENTPLRQQLLNFRQQKQRSGLVVDEYGDIQGLITLEDILTHIVGDIADEHNEEDAPEIVQKQKSVYDVSGGITLRTLNRELGLKLPLDGPNTLSGLIIETLGNFPKLGTVVEFDGCHVKVKTFDNGVVEQAEVTLLAGEER